MNYEEVEKQIREVLGDCFKLLKIDTANFKPHPYMIGPGHVAFAADHYCGALGATAIEGFEKAGGHCVQPGCRLPYNQHTYNTIAFLRLTRTVTSAEANAAIKPIAPILIANNIDGITLVETPEKFRITDGQSTDHTNQAGT